MRIMNFFIKIFINFVRPLFNWLTCLFVLVFVLVPSNYSKADQLPIHMGTFEFPPLFYTGTSKEFTGPVGETIKAIFKTAGLKLTISIWPVKRAYVSFENGLSDVLLTARHERFYKSGKTSDWVYMWGAGIFSKKLGKEIPGSENELIGKKIIVINDWQSPYKVFKYLDKLESEGKVTILRPNSISSAIEMLNLDRAPFLWGSDTFLWTMRELGMDDGRFNYRQLSTIPIVLWVSKKMKHHDRILEKLNRASLLLREKGYFNSSNLLINSQSSPQKK